MTDRAAAQTIALKACGGVWAQLRVEAQAAAAAEPLLASFLHATRDAPYSLTIGHHETFQSLEQMTSSRFTSFIERAQMNDAFRHGRRLGASAGFASGDFRINAGIFNDTINDSFDNDDWLIGARAVYAPKLGDNQLHFGVNYQHREFQSNQLNSRYRARPFLQTTDVRFVDTSAFASEKDDVYGVELAGIFGPLHVAGEAQWVKADAIAPGTSFTGGDAAGTAMFLADDADFFSYYAEIGYWLTGETRGYRNGVWDRTKVLNGFDKGGWGAFQINLRYDYLDLSDASLRTGGVGTSSSRGGKQTGYLLGLTWQPIDYVKFIAQYGHAQIEGGPFAAAVSPTDTSPAFERDYSVDTFALRTQFDF